MPDRLKSIPGEVPRPGCHWACDRVASDDGVSDRIPVVSCAFGKCERTRESESNCERDRCKFQGFVSVTVWISDEIGMSVLVFNSHFL